MTEETFAEKVQRLQREIAVRQAELAYMVLGDPRQSVQASSRESTKVDERARVRESTKKDERR
jgi:hypothetical protein